MVFFGDERCVPPDDPASNYAMAREALLGAVSIPPDQVHRMRGEAASAAQAALDYEGELAVAFGTTAGNVPPRFDLVLLGLGADGHTASLFPGTRALSEARRWVVANRAPVTPTERLTLTYPVLNAAAHVLFLVSGGDKSRALAGVLAASGDPARLPARGVRPVAGELRWIVDRAAAAALPKHSGPTPLG